MPNKTPDEAIIVCMRIKPGDVVLVNGPQGLIHHKQFGEDVALVAAPLLLAQFLGVIEAEPKIVVAH